MPCHPNPISLKQLSLECVALHFEFLCYGVKKGSKKLSEIIESDEYKQYDCPFKEWPSNLLEDLSQVINCKRRGLKHLLYQIIQPQIIQYSIMVQSSIHVAMDLVSKRCPNLVSLNMTYSVNLPPIYYVNFFSHFPKLTQLNLCGSMVDDNAFRVIGKNCPNLIDLNASKTWITNYGVQFLCSNPPFKLLRLNVLETRVTADSLSKLLQRNPNIIRIEHPETLQIFENPSMVNNKRLKLTKLSATKCLIKSFTWKNAIESCSNDLSSLLITSPGLKDQHLSNLIDLKLLQDLHLGNSKDSDITFHNGLVPLLNACGRNLKRLVLENFLTVDIGLIGFECPNLNHLAVSNIDYILFETLSNSENMFKQLSNLEIWSNNENFIDKNALLTIMNNAPLSNMLFQSVSLLDDTLLLSIWEKNAMLNLQNVVFDHCHGITSATLWKLLQTPNQLRILRCWNCKGIPEFVKNDISLLIKQSNFTLYWEWYPYCEDVIQDDIDHDSEEYEIDQ